MLQKLQDDLKGALMARDEVRLSTIRFLLAAIKNLQIERQKDLTNEDIVSVIQKQIKQHHESIEIFEKGNLVEMAAKEKAELEILQSYLPEQMSKEEVEKLVTAAISQTGATELKDMGRVMAALSSQLKGKADMSLVSSLVREKLF